MNLDLKSFAIGVAVTGAVLWGVYVVKVKPVEAALIHDREDLAGKFSDLSGKFSACSKENVNLTANLESQGNLVHEQAQQIAGQGDIVQQQSQRLAVLEMPEASSPLVTLLYDPNVAPQTSQFEILNLLRPGAGTLAGKIYQATRSTGPSGAPRWVIPGYVKPVFNGNARGAFYSWSNLQTGEADLHTPQGTVIQ